MIGTAYQIHNTGHALRYLTSLVFAIVLSFSASNNADAVEPEEMLDDPKLEAEAREISQLLRCLVCQNQSIDESNASLARDLRIIVRERLVAGDTREEVIDYIVSRYGDYVLLKPPVKRQTIILWWGPVVFALFAMGVFVLLFRNRQGRDLSPADEQLAALTPEERARLDKVLQEKVDEQK